MNSSHDCQTVEVAIFRDADAVYDFVADPANLPRWSFFITAVERNGDTWTATTSGGTVTMRFVTRNEFRVLDHQVELPDRTKIEVPMRVITCGANKSVVHFTVLRLPSMNDVQFAQDIGMVEKDLKNLKTVLENKNAVTG